jgi:hypothetical protein
MNTKLQTRLEKLEDRAGINEPCVICETAAKHAERFAELRVKAGLPLRATPSDEIKGLCYWCLRLHTTDVTGYSLSERALMERVYSAYEEGRMCTPEFERDKADLEAITAEREEVMYGPEIERVCADIELEMGEAMYLAGEPKLKYVCQVPGCDCLGSRAA